MKTYNCNSPVSLYQYKLVVKKAIRTSLHSSNVHELIKLFIDVKKSLALGNDELICPLIDYGNYEDTDKAMARAIISKILAYYDVCVLSSIAIKSSNPAKQAIAPNKELGFFTLFRIYTLDTIIKELRNYGK